MKSFFYLNLHDITVVIQILWLHTSNSSQNPCLGFSELSATLLSSRTRFSMLAAFILVALNGYCRHILTKKTEYTVKIGKMQRNECCDEISG